MIAVGRLDMASTGLLLLTTDTQLAAHLTDPGAAIIRRYIVTARGRVSDEDAARWWREWWPRRARCSGAEAFEPRDALAIELTEGKNREIRRLLAATGHDVSRLLRVAFGGIELGQLKPGEWREVTREDRRAFHVWRGSRDCWA